MIKYGILDEYKCTKCGETVAVPKQASLEELEKVASAGECAHTFERTEETEKQKESPEN
jgi:hypothetical protein